MAIRCLLHKNKLKELKSWLSSQDLEWREGQGPYQLMQIRKPRLDGWDVIYERNDMKEHVTVVEPLIPLVRRFISESQHGR